MKKHKSNFPLAFTGVSHYVTGNLKTAAREIRKELLAEIRKCADARAVREVIHPSRFASWIGGVGGRGGKETAVTFHIQATLCVLGSLWPRRNDVKNCSIPMNKP